MPTVMDQFRLDDRIAVVTGGSKGLGKAMAEAFCQAGAQTVICSRTESEAQVTAADITSRTGQSCHALTADVTNADDVRALVDSVMTQHERIDVWVNNAGVNIRHLIEDFPLEDFDRVVDTNIKGTWLCCRAVSPILKRQRRGCVINLGSVLSATGLAERTAYSAAKTAILGLTRTLALEWAEYEVRCNALCPGPFLTELNRVLLDDPAKVQAVLSPTAFRRWGELHEIQGAALFLASDASSYMTGAALFVDGGWSAA